MQTFQTEQNIRTLVNEQLKNLDWNLKHGETCNVFQEQPRTNEEKKKLKGKRPDYVLYSRKQKSRKEPLIIIETKKPGANLDEALTQGNWYAEQLEAPMVFATDGVYYKTLHTKFNKPLYLNGEEVDELIRELEALKFLDYNEVDTISKEVKYSRDELIKIFEDANNLLRNEGLRAGIERFGEFANILFLKLIGEIEDLKEKEGKANEIKLDRYLRWSQWKREKGDRLLDFVNNTVLPKIGEAYRDDEIFLPLSIKNASVLEKIIDMLEPLNLINIDSDIKGDSFEYFLKKSTATRNDLGEYFTPRHIVKTMVKLINPRYGERIYDPFCGTGGMLIESFKHIYNNMPQNKKTLKTIREETIFGNEITSTARITKMNMILIGDGHCGVEQKDSLKVPVNGKYDAVITNMPYSQKTEYGAFYDIPSTNGDSICIQHCIKAIDNASANGRMAIVVPEGFLFRKNMQATREYVLKKCTLKSIISLPQGVFLPYTSVKTNILYCTDIKKKKRQEKIWYFNVQNDGFSLDSHRRKIKGSNDLQRFLEHRNIDVREDKEITRIGFSVLPVEEVKNNNFIFVGSHYEKILDYSGTMCEMASIKNVATIIRGVTYSKKDESTSKTHKIILRSNNIDLDTSTLDLTEVRYLRDDFDIAEEKKLTKNDILVCTSSGSKAHLGKFAMIEENVDNYAGGFMSIIRLDINKVLPRYLHYILRSKQYRRYIERITTGSNINNLKNSDIETFKIPLLSLEKQRQIVDELEKLQLIVKHARQITKIYEPKINISNEWKFFKIGEIVSIRPPKTEVNKIKKDTLVSFVPMGCLKKHGYEIDLKETRKLSTVYKGYTYFRNNDVLLAKITPCFENGKSGIARHLTNNIGFGSTEFIVLRPTSRVLPEWLYYFISQRDFLNHGANRMTGSAGQQRIGTNFVENYKIPVPPLKVQKDIIDKLNTERNLIATNKKTIELFENQIDKKIDFIWGK